MFAAFVYDAAESYDIAFIFFVIYFVVAAFFIWLARPPVHPTALRPLQPHQGQSPSGILVSRL